MGFVNRFMSLNPNEDNPNENEKSPAQHIRMLTEDIQDDIQNAFEFVDLDEEWRHSVAYVDKADIENDWWDTELWTNDVVPSDVITFHTEVQEACDDLIQSVSATGQNGSDESSLDVERALFSMTRLEAAADRFDSQLSTANQVFNFTSAAKSVYKKVKNWIKKKLKPIIKNISNQLWKLIKKLKNLENWTLSGDLGASVLGLQGTAGIALTFD